MSGKIDSFTEDCRFLSNFYPSPFILDCQWGREVMAPTVEHAYQAEKAKYQRDWLAIMQATNPGTAKRMGRSIELRDDWEEVKLPTMNKLVRLKFEIPTLTKQLLSTGDAELIEGNSWGDTFWGVCGGKGENHLGRILMNVRDELRERQT